jgi:hypothetical protein
VPWYAALPFLVSVSAAPHSETPPPAALACVERYYAGRAERRPTGWALVLPDGHAIPYDDGRTKTPDERIESPDVEDTFSTPYPTGPIVPVTDPAHDPGRARLDALFRATYGTLDLVHVPLLGQEVRVHRRAADALRRVAGRLEAAVAHDPSLRPFLTGVTTFNARAIAGTTRPSPHSWGIALDLSPQRSHYWRWDVEKEGGLPRWRNRIPHPIVTAFEQGGFIWGGRWYHYDTMHFEWRPELLDPSCSPRP